MSNRFVLVLIVWWLHSETRVVLESLLEHAVSKRTAKSQTRREVLDHLDFTEKQLQLVTVEMKDKICKMVEEVEHKVKTRLDHRSRARTTLFIEQMNR